jgi:hypothetical protein
MVATTMKRTGPLHDPPVRRDGNCVNCGGPRPNIEDPKGIYRVYEDPFCSTKCCKEYYNVSYDHDMSR